jgi:hypothetical protein
MYDSASVAAIAPHFEDLSDIRVSNLSTVNCIRVLRRRPESQKSATQDLSLQSLAQHGEFSRPKRSAQPRIEHCSC